MASENRVQSETPSSYDDEDSNIYDCVAIVIRCLEHKTIGLQKLPGKNYIWLPVIKLNETDRPEAAISKLMTQLLKTKAGVNVKFTDPIPLQVCRFQVSQQGQYYEVHTFVANLIKTGGKCCSNLQQLTWLSKIEVDEPNVWGTEPAMWLKFAHYSKTAVNQTSDKSKNGKDVLDFDKLVELTVLDTHTIIAKIPPRGVYDQLLITAKLEKKEIQGLYADFIEHCFPSRSMNQTSFGDYMVRIGWTNQPDELVNLYRSFKYNNAYYVRVNEFIYGMAAFSSTAGFTDKLIKLRCNYIFNYYDSDCNQVLSNDEMFNVRKDIMISLKPSSLSHEEVINAVFNDYEKLGIPFKHAMNLSEFNKAVHENKLTGVSQLCRAPAGVIERRLALNSSESSRKSTSSKGPPCESCRPKHYVMAAHEVTLAVDGQIIGPKEVPGAGIKQSVDQKIESIELFTGNSPAHKVLKWIRELPTAKLAPKTGVSAAPTRDFYKEETSEEITSSVLQVLQMAKQLVSRQPRVLKVNSPCYVLGDLHGNLHDLMAYESILWRKAPVAEAGSFLFLGDYVDRHPYAVEVVLYLFCMKLLAPTQFHLLRGNHEVRHMQVTFTFKRECEKKFGSSEVWEAYNQAFDCLPVCAVIDESIFCAHGGIPTSTLDITAINFPKPMPDPQHTCPPAWEMLWNDPITSTELTEYTDMQRARSDQSSQANASQGYIVNSKRGTAFYFSHLAADRFLQVNNLSHIIRAHEVMAEGYGIFHKGKTITVFSCSRYCKGVNEAACIFICDQKLRPIKLDAFLQLM